MSFLKKIILILLFCCFKISSFADERDDAEKLYEVMKSFLNENKDHDPENFYDVCLKYLLQMREVSIKNPKRDIVLYRGVKNLEYASDFKKGIFFLSPWNIRGSGVYTTTSRNCAKFYSDEKNPKTLLSIQIDLNNVKILDNDYLEKLKKIVVEKHHDEFGDFDAKTKEDFIFDSLKEYLERKEVVIKKEVEALEKLNLSSEKFLQRQEKILKDFVEHLQQDPTFQKLKSERKKYFIKNKAWVWFNNGLLTRLLNYDVLHCTDFLRDFVDFKEEEFLIVNTGIIKMSDSPLLIV